MLEYFLVYEVEETVDYFDLLSRLEVLIHIDVIPALSSKVDNLAHELSVWLRYSYG